MKNNNKENFNLELDAVRAVIAEEVAAGKMFLIGEDGITPVCLLSRLLFSTADFGSFDRDQVKLVGAALELLELALVKHYSVVEDAASNRDNTEFHDLRLISGDYYYARAISLVDSLGGVVVSGLARSIAEFAAAITDLKNFSEPGEQFKVGIQKLAALYKTSAVLGGFLGKVSQQIGQDLEKFAICVGAARILSQNEFLKIDRKLRQGWTEHYLTVAKSALAKLPAGKAKSGLKQLL